MIITGLVLTLLITIAALLVLLLLPGSNARTDLIGAAGITTFLVVALGSIIFG